MHILYIYQYFGTPLACCGTRSYGLARRWVAKGHKVTILTSTVRLADTYLSAAKGRFVKRMQIDGIDVLALNVYYNQQMGVLRRCWSFLAFLLLASVVALFVPKVDIIYASSTPLTVGVPALVAKWFKRRKLVFEVRDQWPESPIEIGIIRNRFLIKFLIWFEKTIYRQSAAIVAVSSGMAEDIKLLAGEKPVHVIPNCADLDMFKPGIDGKAFCEKYGLAGKLVFLHAGSMGIINDLDFVIRAAEKVKDHNDIVFVTIGKGNHKLFLQERVKKLGLTNVMILPPMLKQELPAALAAADVVMAIIGKYPIIERHASLNKFYEGISCGKPILLNYSGWQRELIEKADAGLGCRLCDVDEFVNNVLYISQHREHLPVMGRNARSLAEEFFDRGKLADHLENILQGMVKKA